MKQHEDTAPLLKMGALQMHLKMNQAGKYSYYGGIFPELADREYGTKKEGLTDFVNFIKRLPVEQQQDIVGGLRPDVFAKVLTNYKEPKT